MDVARPPVHVRRATSGRARYRYSALAGRSRGTLTRAPGPAERAPSGPSGRAARARISRHKSNKACTKRHSAVLRFGGLIWIIDYGLCAKRCRVWPVAGYR